MFHARPAGIVFSALLLFPAEGRTWTDVHGRTFEAELVGKSGDALILELEGGRRFRMPLERLAESERIRLGKEQGEARASTLAGNWPREVRHDRAVKVRVVSEDRGSRRFVYESPHYRFTSNVRLTDEVLRSFAVLFETTHLYCQQLPLALLKHGSGKLAVRLFETDEQYVRAGGSPGSAGCFVPARREVLAPVSSLGLVPIPGGHRLDPSRQNLVLVHELAHQLTPSNYYRPGALGWFSEGLAEYVATTPYSWGYFKVDPHGNAARAYLTAFGRRGKAGRNLGTSIAMPRLDRFMTQSYGSFTSSHANLNYGASLFLVHFFFHLEGRGDAASIRRFLGAMNSGASEAEALRVLLAGRSFEQLEQEFARAWRSKGVTIRFE